jgi:peptidoglycan/LPS O-acetylase OafA/YrhL
MTKGEIRALTGLRGVAASWVVFHHLHEDDTLGSWTSYVLIHGYLAVDIFFVLSGFVMALSYKHLFDGGFSRRGYALFLGRRLGRVWPLYALATLVYAGIFAVASKYGVVYHHITVQELPFLIPINLAMIQTWGLGPTLGAPAWSVSTEFAAYLLFPVLSWLTLFHRGWTVWFIGIVAGGVVCLLPVLSGQGFLGPRPLDIFDYHTLWPVLRCIAEFTLGLVAFRVAYSSRASRILSRLFATILVPVVMVLLTPFPNTDLPFVFLSGLLIVQLSKQAGPVSRLLGSRAIHFLGVMSYGLYLCHYALLHLHAVSRYLIPFLGQGAADVAADLIVFLVALAVATLGYRLVELPSREAVKRALRRMDPVVAQATIESETMGLEEATKTTAGRVVRPERGRLRIPPAPLTSPYVENGPRK